jgi:endonuclease-8
MPEGDTIHRVAARIDEALAGREITHAAAPSPRSPLHGRAEALRGRTLERTEARGKHLLIHISGGLAVHSHLGMSGRWRIETGGAPPPPGRSWLALAGPEGSAAQHGGKLLRLGTESRLAADLTLARLGPDPLAPGFDVAAAAHRLRAGGAGLRVGEALLDQRLLAGIGNAIRCEACFAAAISPWRPVAQLSSAEAERLVGEVEAVMRTSLVADRRPRRIYRATREDCPACGGRVRARGQGDANRTAYWCPRCQPSRPG